MIAKEAVLAWTQGVISTGDLTETLLEAISNSERGRIQPMNSMRPTATTKLINNRVKSAVRHLRWQEMKEQI